MNRINSVILKKPMKSSEFIMEIIKTMDKIESPTQEEMLKTFAEEYEEEIRFKVLEIWGMYLNTKSPTFLY